MKTFTMASDETHETIVQIAARAIAGVDQAAAAIGQRLADDQRKAAEQRRRLFQEQQQALRAIEAQTLARVRQIAAEIAQLN